MSLEDALNRNTEAVKELTIALNSGATSTLEVPFPSISEDIVNDAKIFGVEDLDVPTSPTPDAPVGKTGGEADKKAIAAAKRKATREANKKKKEAVAAAKKEAVAAAKKEAEVNTPPSALFDDEGDDVDVPTPPIAPAPPPAPVKNDSPYYETAVRFTSRLSQETGNPIVTHNVVTTVGNIEDLSLGNDDQLVAIIKGCIRSLCDLNSENREALIAEGYTPDNGWMDA